MPRRKPTTEPTTDNLGPPLLRRWTLFMLAVAACHSQPTTGNDAGATTATSSTISPPPEPKTEFASAGTIQLELQKYAPLEFLAHGTWVAFSPKGKEAIVGGPGRAAVFP